MLKSRSSTNGRVTSPQQPEDKAFFLTETQRYTDRGRHLESGKGEGRKWRKEILNLKTPAREATRFGDPVRESGRLALFLG